MTQMTRVTRALEAARLEVANLLPEDHVLRALIIADLDTLIANLRASSVQAASHTLP